MRNLKEDMGKEIKRYSDVYSDERRNQGWWYFTTHGVQPGSVPKGVNILEVRDTPNGTYFRADAILNTSELEYYDIKERVPKEEESLKESASMDSAQRLEDDGWTVLSHGVRGGDSNFYWLARRMNKERGKADWKAINDKTGEVIDITYEQALEREPIGVSSGISKLSKKLGKVLLPQKINIRESLNKYDLRTDNKYDLRNLYDACIMTDKEKRIIAEMISKNTRANVLYEALMNKFEGKELKEDRQPRQGFLKKYNGYQISYYSGRYVITNKNGLTVGESNSLIGAEARIDEKDLDDPLLKNESLKEEDERNADLDKGIKDEQETINLYDKMSKKKVFNGVERDQIKEIRNDEKDHKRLLKKIKDGKLTRVEEAYDDAEYMKNRYPQGGDNPKNPGESNLEWVSRWVDRWYPEREYGKIDLKETPNGGIEIFFVDIPEGLWDDNYESAESEFMDLVREDFGVEPYIVRKTSRGGDEWKSYYIPMEKQIKGQMSFIDPWTGGVKGFDESLKESADDDLLSSCKEKYRRLIDIADSASDFSSIEEVITAMFNEVGGKVYFEEVSRRYASFSGDVNGYSLWNSVSMEYQDGDLHRLAEDLTMAFYRTNGGQGYNTYTLMDKIRGTNESLKESKSLKESADRPVHSSSTNYNGEQVSIELWDNGDEYEITINEYSGDDISQETREAVEDVVSRYGWFFDDASDGEDAVDSIVNYIRREYCYPKNESLKEGVDDRLRQKAEPLANALDDLIDRDDGFYITYSIGMDDNGAVTGGVDFELFKSSRTEEEARAEIERVFDENGFELDRRFKTNPGKTLFGRTHYQIIEKDK